MEDNNNESKEQLEFFNIAQTRIFHVIYLFQVRAFVYSSLLRYPKTRETVVVKFFCKRELVVIGQ